VRVVGGPPSGSTARFDINGLLAGKTIRGILEGDSVPAVFIPRMIEWYVAGQFPFDKLIRFYNLEGIECAAADAASGAVVKPVLRMGAPAPGKGRQT
jgi:aryl-alcohol dehydrogenase